MNTESRKQILIAVTLVLVLAVLADQFGVFDRFGGGGGGASEPIGAKAELLASQEALIAKRAEWARAKADADAVLDEIGGRMIRGKTVQLAENELRERAEREMGVLGLVIDSSNGATPGAEQEHGIRRVGVVLNITADDPTKVNELVDRLENMSDLVTSVERVKLVGPGTMPSRASVEATITLMGLAMIDGGEA